MAEKSAALATDERNLGNHITGAVKGRNNGVRFKNRNRMEIVANLLTIARNGALKTHLMYKANLSYLMVTEYLSYLSSAELIRETLDDEGTTKLYLTTPKGIKYLEAYESLQSIAGLGSRNSINMSSSLFG
jgi:predicted transcriptional regulator